MYLDTELTLDDVHNILYMYIIHTHTHTRTHTHTHTYIIYLHIIRMQLVKDNNIYII